MNSGLGAGIETIGLLLAGLAMLGCLFLLGLMLAQLVFKALERRSEAKARRFYGILLPPKR